MPASLFLVVTFVMVAVAVAGAVVAVIARAVPRARAPALAAAVAWLAGTAGVAASGALGDFSARPPPFGLVLLASTALALALGLSRLGAAVAGAVPLWLLVGFQGFRLPLELVMHRAAAEGVMPAVMSFGAGGRNFDIVTGALALGVALLIKRGAPRAIAGVWVALAFVTLVNVVAIAILASPLFSWFGPDQLNTWVARAPFVWLPTVLVASALAGQIVVVRALLGAARGATSMQTPA